MRFLLTPASGRMSGVSGVMCFRKASHSGISSGWSCMGTGPSTEVGIGGGKREDNRTGSNNMGGGDDKVASMGDKTGVTGMTGAL